MSKNRRPQRSYNSQNQSPDRPIELIVRQPYYDMIDQERKTIEGRVAYRSLARAQEGMQLNFRRNQQDDRAIKCDITSVLRAATFEEALIEVEWQKAIPDAGTFDEALAVYERIYPPEKVREVGGVVLLGFNKKGIDVRP
jgi:ASC-1-like (ASCH) protein